MGFDISSHPVDVQLIQTRILPYLRGQGTIDDLLADAVRLTKVRFRANAWGLGALNVQHKEQEDQRAKKKAKDGSAAVTQTARDFDSDLHVWGRPFFITVPTEQLASVLDRYLAASPEQVDAIAMAQLYKLHPDLVNQVQPDADSTLPNDGPLADSIRQEIDVLKSAYQNIASGKSVKLPTGEKVDPEDLLLFNMPLAVVTFAANFTPGWMARGHVWFTQFIQQANLDADGLYEPATSLFEPLLNTIGGWEEAFEPTITQNYTLGGYVRPANVTAFRTWWEAHREPLLAPFAVDDEQDYGAVCYQKILEAVREAERRKFGFVEAAEVYSGFMGIMN